GAVLLVPGRGGGRVARRPQGKPPQRRIVGGRIGGAHLQVLGLGARIRERLADFDSFRLGGCVQGGDARRARHIGGEDERPRRINRLAGRRGRGEKAQD